MKRLLKPSEIIFPELLDKSSKIKGQKYIKLLCPDCELNDNFKILEVVRIPRNEGSRHRCGLYRCQCTACDYTTVIKSKNPNTRYS